ncbi:hypothetical protein BKI52_01615 [marine bacterium AO1-C]|nr:hypothetical protein BKI52_01615 [marine bacterium AO1-C]
MQAAYQEYKLFNPKHTNKMIKLFSNYCFGKRKRTTWLFLIMLISLKLTAQSNAELVLSATKTGGKKLEEYTLGEPLYATWTVDEEMTNHIEKVEQKHMLFTVYGYDVKSDRRELIFYNLPQKIVVGKRYTQPLFIPENPKSILAMMLKKSKKKLPPNSYEMRFDIFIGNKNIAKNRILVHIDQKNKDKILSMRRIPKAAKDKEYKRYKRDKFYYIGGTLLAGGLGLAVSELRPLLYAAPLGIYGVLRSKKKTGHSEIEKQRIWGRNALDKKLKEKAEKLANTLKGKDIFKLAINPAYNFVTPGDVVPFSVTAILRNDKQLITKGHGNGKVSWDEYRLEVKGGVVSNHKIVVTTNGFELQKLKHKVYVKVISVHQPQMSETIAIPVKFDNLDYGFSGWQGSDGQGGYHRAHNGQKGARGQNGRNGENGPTVEVYIDVVEDKVTKQKMRLHKIIATNSRQPYIVFTHLQGKLSIDASGGHGGRGGDGGGGGNSDPCAGIIYPGSGGDGGNGGTGGNGGAFVIYCTPEANKYKGYITLSSNGGFAGERGRAGTVGSLMGGGTDCPQPTYGSATRGRDGQRGYPGNPGGYARYKVEKFTIKDE